MIVGLLGSLLRVVARLDPGEGGRDLDAVGAELERLERPPAYAATTSR
jgi:hypothetical protein